MKTYLRILGYAKPYAPQIFLHAVFITLAVIFAGLTLAMLQPLLELLFYKDQAIPDAVSDPALTTDFLKTWIKYKAAGLLGQDNHRGVLLIVTLFIVGLNIMGNIFKYFANIYLAIVRTKVVEKLRDDVFSKMLKLHVAYIESRRKGDIMTRITSDVSEVETSVVITFEALLRDPITIIFFLTLMIMKSWQLTLFIFVMLPVTAVVISFISKSLKKDAYGTQDTYGYIMSMADETISGIRIIKAFNAEGYIKRVFDKFNQQYSVLSRRQWFKKALVPVFSESSGVITVGLIMWFGGNLVYEGEMEASEFIPYIALFSQIIKPAKTLSQAFSNIYKGIASGDRLFQLMDEPVYTRDKENPQRMKSFERSIELRNVTFEYVKGTPVLKDINLTIEKGKIYALVGPSGSGKSTLAELVLRFYDPTEGALLIDSVDMQEVKLTDLRDMMAVVTQEPILFNDTIYNNIAFGMEGVNEADVISAAKAANAHDFILASENGYQTLVGDRGGLLSGGQRQRLSIARAILKNPPILILDEATSALDTSSEKIVQDALYRLMENRTSLVIAHRLSTIQDADEIIVLEKGEIAEKGRHQELMLQDGIYRSLHHLQQLEA